jgi:hypothetical protein
MLEMGWPPKLDQQQKEKYTGTEKCEYFIIIARY